MKKTYIAPAVNTHQIAIETEILALSDNRAIFGNRGRYWDKNEKIYDRLITDPDEDWAIDVIEGDDWETL